MRSQKNLLKVQKLLRKGSKKRGLFSNLTNHHGQPEKGLKVCELLFTPSLSVLEEETEKDEIIRQKYLNQTLK